MSETHAEDGSTHILFDPHAGHSSGCVGAKHDDGKAPWHLLPWSEVRDVVHVLGYGARKYAPGNWRLVADARNRYFAAAQRHMCAWFDGERFDDESGLPHLAHAACCLLFLAAFDREEAKR